MKKSCIADSLALVVCNVDFQCRVPFFLGLRV
jgi:hypothetical protein